MYEQKDLDYVDYCNQHTDISVGLTASQIEQYVNYMNRMIKINLKKIGALVDGSVELRGISGEWFTGLKNATIDTNFGSVGYSAFLKYFPERLSMVTAVFSSLYSDLQYISYLLREKKVEEWEKQYTPDKAEVFSSDFSSPEFDICKSFYFKNMPIPISLLPDYKEAWNYASKDTKLRKFYTLSHCEYTEFLDTNIKLFDLINKQVVMGLVATNDTELANLVVQFNAALLRVQSLGYTPDMLMDLPRQKVYKTAGRNGIRLATLGEIGSLPPQTTCVEEVFLDKNKYERILVFCWFCTGSDRVIKLLNRFSDNTLSKLSNSTTRTIIKLVLDYMLSPNLTVDLAEIEKEKSKIKYMDTAYDEVIDIPFADKCREVYRVHKDILSRAPHKGNGYSYDKMLVSIADQYLHGRTLTDKQVKLVNNDFTSIKNGDKKDNFYSAELEQKIKELRAWFNYDKHYTPNAIMDSILKFKKCSEKQLSVVNSEYEKYLEEKQGGVEQTSTQEQKSPAPVQQNRQVQQNTTNVQQNTAPTNVPFVPNFGAENRQLQTQPATKVPVRPFSYGDYDWEEVDI